MIELGNLKKCGDKSKKGILNIVLKFKGIVIA